MSLTPPEKVGKLQAALHTKAKNAPDYRFHALYDKIYRRDVLEHAFHRCRINAGAAGVDGQTFADIEAYGEDRWLDALAEELGEETYQPQPARRVFIPKPDGKPRPLGIPSPGASVAGREVRGEWSREDTLHERSPPRRASASSSPRTVASAES